MLENLLTDEEETSGNENVVLQKAAKNTIEHVSNEDVLGRMETKRTKIRISKKEVIEFSRYIMRNEDMENLTFTGLIEGTEESGA